MLATGSIDTAVSVVPVLSSVQKNTFRRSVWKVQESKAGSQGLLSKELGSEYLDVKRFCCQENRHMARHCRQRKGDNKKTPDEAWSGESKKRSKASCPELSPDAIASGAKRQKVCAFCRPLCWQETEDEEKTTAELTASRQTSIPPTDTVASSVGANES